MRDVNGNLTDAITLGTTFKASARITAYKSRVFFEEADLVSEPYSPPELDYGAGASIDEGGVRFAIDGSSSPGRLFDPTKVLTDYADSDILAKAGVAVLGDKTFMYFTRYDGAVIGIYKQGSSWSDFFIAIPEDLSSFDITSVWAYNNRIFMTGNFYRKEQFSSGANYTLFCYSDDGFTFSLDRATLVTTIGDTFYSYFDEYSGYAGELVFTNGTMGYRTSAPYQVIGESADSIDLLMQTLSGSMASGWQAALRAGAEEYYTNPLVVEGGFSKLEVGVSTASGGLEWVKYHDCVISSVARNWADGARNMTIQIMPDGLWKTSVMTHPYYMEWQGKQRFESAMKDTVGFEDISGGSGQHWSLTQDFWITGDQDGYTRETHVASTSTDDWASDPVDATLLVHYPTFGDPADFPTYQIDIYGWSRTGLPSNNPNGPGETEVAGSNDEFYGLLLVEDLDGNQSTLVTVIGDLVSDYSNPEQTYYGTRAGSYPVSYTIPNPGNGWKILKMGVRVVSSDVTTTYYLERISMPGMPAEYTTVVGTGYQVIDDPDVLGEKEGETIVVNTQKGVDQVVFSTPAPYSSWNFELMGKFKIEGAYTHAGLVGLATDTENYIIGYVRPGYIGLMKMRNGQRYVVVEQADAGITDGITLKVRFWHRDGVFGVEWKDPAVATWPTRGSMLLYEWTEDDGAITIETPIVTTEDTGLKTDATGAYVYHMGIWSLIDPPKFRTCGFKSTGTMIPIMPTDVDLETGDSNFALFPDTDGQVSCDDYVYEYSAKTAIYNDTILGPYQLRNILDWYGYDQDIDDGYTYVGIRAVEFYNFKWLSDISNHDMFKDAMLCTNTGYQWIAGETFFKPWITTGGVVMWQLERMRVYGKDDIIPEGANDTLIDKVWITKGLTGIAPVDPTPYEVTHEEGSFVYVHNDDCVTLLGFIGVSGDEDINVESLLDKICKISGTQADFPGDLTIDSATGTITL